MKGIINKGVEEFLVNTYGEKMWAEVKQKAHCDASFFALGKNYPDKTTLDLMIKTAEISGLSPEKVMINYGKYIVANTLKNNYPAYFQLAGSSVKEFLMNINRIHHHVTNNVPGAVPPKFEYEELSGHKIHLRYFSERKLCAVLYGLIQGVGLYFSQPLQVREVACLHRGDPHCIMEVTFSEEK